MLVRLPRPFFPLGFRVVRGHALMACLGLALALPHGAVEADTVWMNNGDRLTGEVKELDAERLSLLTPYGVIALEWHQIEAIESAAEIVARDETARQAYLSRLRPAEDGAAVIAVAQETGLPEAAVIEQVLVPRPFVHKPTWQGSLELGFNYKTASTRTEDYTATVDTELRHASWRHNIYANYLRRTDDAATTAHLFGGNIASDRFLTGTLFWQGRARYKWDQIEEVSQQTALGTGPGYQFWDNETGAFSLSGLMGRLRYDYNDGGSDSFFAASLRWDYKRYFLDSNRLELYSTGELTRPLNSSSDINLDAVVGMRYRMTDWLSWFLSYSRNQISGSRQNLNEKRISTGLGVSW